MPREVTRATITDDPQAYESQHVHAVYDEIAPHFSATRYKPWPIVEAFFESLPAGYVGLDSGTGNGKYLPLPLDRPPGSVWTIGLDRSRNLLQIAKHAGPEGRSQREVVWGDVLGRGWRPGAFDYVVSVATIHHLCTHERRKLAVQRLLQCVSPRHGRVLIYVWATEQDQLSKRTIPRGSGETVVTGSVAVAGEDVFVPWVMADSIGPRTFNRYYHMFAPGELRQLVLLAAQDLGLMVGTENGIVAGRGVDVVQDGWERSNYYVELRLWER